MSKPKLNLQVDITPVILGTIADFKRFVIPIDEAENKKLLIEIRQIIKHHPDVKWRRRKLKYVVDRIISLEFTTKSRGRRLVKLERLDDDEL